MVKEQRLPSIVFHTKEKSQKKRALRQKRSLPFISLTLPVLLIVVGYGVHRGNETLARKKTEILESLKIEAVRV